MDVRSVDHLNEASIFKGQKSKWEMGDIGKALNGDIELSLKDRKICFLLLFYDRTVLFG